ncbi:MAG: hypothetical protein ABUK01_15995 [Leptospirales bacterium]
MKTTMLLPDPLLEAAKGLAHDEGSSLTKVFERALQEYVARKRGKAPAKLKENHFKGKGFADPAYEGNWDKIRSEIYEGRGDV